MQLQLGLGFAAQNAGDPNVINFGAVRLAPTGQQYDLLVAATNSNGASGSPADAKLDRRVNPDAFMVMTFPNDSAYDNTAAYKAEPFEGEGSSGDTIGWMGAMLDAWTTNEDVSVKKPLGFRLVKPGSGFTATPVTPGDWSVADDDLWSTFKTRIDQLRAGVPNTWPACCILLNEENDVGVLTGAQFVTETQAQITDIRSYFGRADLPIVYIPPRPQWNVAAASDIENAVLGMVDTTSYFAVADLTGVIGGNIHYTDNAQQLRDITGPAAYAAFAAAEIHNNPGGTDAVATAPDAVADLAATAGNSSVSLSWTAPANGGASIRGYSLQSSPDGSTGWTDLVQPLSEAPTVTGLTNGVIQYFRVAAYNVAGQASYSNVANATPVSSLSNSLEHDLTVDVGVGSVTDSKGAATITATGITYQTLAGTDAFVVDAGGDRLSWPGVHGDSFTYSMWVYGQMFTALRAIMSEWASDGTTLRWRYYYNNTVGSNHRYTNSIDAGLVTTVDQTLDTNQWHHHVLTCDHGATDTWTHYLDGAQVDQVAGVTPRTHAVGDLWAIGYANANAASSNALVSGRHRPMVWSRALTADEVSALYAVGRTGGTL